MDWIAEYAKGHWDRKLGHGRKGGSRGSELELSWAERADRPPAFVFTCSRDQPPRFRCRSNTQPCLGRGVNGRRTRSTPRQGWADRGPTCPRAPSQPHPTRPPTPNSQTSRSPTSTKGKSDISLLFNAFNRLTHEDSVASAGTSWLPAPRVQDEDDRRRALYRSKILQADSHKVLDKIVRLAQKTFGVMTVLIMMWYVRHALCRSLKGSPTADLRSPTPTLLARRTTSPSCPRTGSMHRRVQGARPSVPTPS